MAQALNLIQMFMNRSNPSADAIKGAEKKAGADNKLNNEALLGAQSSKNASSFQAKVRASQAQLTARNAKLKAESHSIDTLGSKPVAKNKPSESSEKSSRGQNAKEAIKTQSHDQREKAISAKQIDRSQKPETAKATAKPERDIQNTSKRNTPSDGTQETAEAALEDRLERLGVKVTSEQLSDPEFLSEMLQYLQAMTSVDATDLGLEDAGVSPDLLTLEGIGSEGTDSETGLASGLSQDGKSANTTKSDAGRPGSQEVAAKDLTELIKNRLAEIAQGNKSGAGSEGTPGTENWKDLRIAQSESNLASDPISKSELDRLRVMQASSLQVGSNGGVGEFDVEALAEEVNDNLEINAIEGGSMETEENQDATGNDAEASGQKQEQGQSQASGMASRNENAQLLKDGSNGIHFNQSLDQARSAEAKTGAERVWAPQRSAFDQNILQQISKKLNGTAHLSGGEISIQLEPENLGKIKVGVGLKDGVMNARIGVENENIRQIVEANLASLKETLENQGLKIESLEVSIEQRHSSLFNPDGSNSESFFHQRGQGKNGEANNSDEKSGLEMAPESETGRRLGYNTMEYIG